MHKINIPEKLSLFHDHWNPRIVGELNGQHVKLAKFQGEFVWHKHDEEDELFYVLSGEFRMEFRDHSVTLRENEFLIVPRGVEHRPVVLRRRVGGQQPVVEDLRARLEAGDADATFGDFHPRSLRRTTHG